jgi:hypothetical protein
MKAKNCAVLGDGSQPGDFAHVKTGTPMDLKLREFQESKQYRTEGRIKSAAKARWVKIKAKND